MYSVVITRNNIKYWICYTMSFYVNFLFDIFFNHVSLQVDLCGHATLASAHFLLTSGITEAQTLEFLTRSAILKATKLDLLKENNLSRPCNDGGESFLIELNFPLIEAINLNSAEIPSIPNTLNGLSIVNIQKGNQDGGDIIVHTQFFDFFILLWIGLHKIQFVFAVS